jgi:hypothetical protein
MDWHFQGTDVCFLLINLFEQKSIQNLFCTASILSAEAQV